MGLIRTTSSAIKFGSFSLFDFKGLIVDNITIVDSNRGHRFQIRDEGTLSSFVFQWILQKEKKFDLVEDKPNAEVNTSSSYIE